jgi:hypothetical protein
MTVFLLSGAHTNQSAHLTVAIAPGIARGLIARGVEVKVAWAGYAKNECGVEHIPYWQPFDTKPGDFMLVTDPNIFDVLSRHPWTNLPRKGLFTSCDHSDKDFSQYELILAENQCGYIAAKYPRAKVFDFLMGCEEHIDVSTTSPYVNPKTAFFCGRMGEYPPRHNVRLDYLRTLAMLLPDYHFIFLANSMSLPADVTPDDLKGCVMLPIPHDPADAAAVDRTAGSWKLRGQRPRLKHTQGVVSYVNLPCGEAVEIVNKAIGTQNLAYWGVRNWGTFWGLHRHAACTLDFGFASESAGPNTKVIDPLRAGTRVVAAGMSSTFKLVRQYGGVVVPDGDMVSMAAAIRSLPVESFGVKAARGEAFAREHSWTVKIGRVLDQLGAGYFA